MKLSKNELIDIKNSIIFKSWLEDVLRLMPKYKKGGIRLDSFATVILMNEDIPTVLGDGWTKHSIDWFDLKIRDFKRKTGHYIRHLGWPEQKFGSYKFLAAILTTYKNFVDDKEWVFFKERTALDNNIKKLEGYIDKYVKIVDWMWPPKKAVVPGWVKKYWKILNSRS